MPSSISTISTTENKIIHDTWLQLFTGVEMTRTRDFSSRCRCWSRVVFADQCFVDQYLDDMCLGDMRLDKMYLEVRCLDSLQNFTPAVITSCWSVEVTKLLLLGNIVTKYNLLVGGRNTVVSWPWSRDAILSHRNAIRISRFLALSRRISPHLILCISSALSPSRTLSLSLYISLFLAYRIRPTQISRWLVVTSILHICPITNYIINVFLLYSRVWKPCYVILRIYNTHTQTHKRRFM